MASLSAVKPPGQWWRRDRRPKSGGRKKKPFMFFSECVRGRFPGDFFIPFFFFAIFRPCFPAAAVFSRVPLIFSEKLPLPSFLLFPFLQQENGFHDRSNFDPRNHSPPSSPSSLGVGSVTSSSLFPSFSSTPHQKRRFFLKKRNRITKQIWETRRPPPPLKKR